MVQNPEKFDVSLKIIMINKGGGNVSYLSRLKTVYISTENMTLQVVE